MTITPDDLPDTWCLMWNEDASLAHELITPDGRWCSGVAAGADALLGPQDTQDFVERYQREVGLRFTVGTVVIDERDRLAYTWEATARDGSVLTGADVCVLHEGRVALNWTLPGRTREDDVGAPTAGGPEVGRARLEELAEAWASAQGVVRHREPVVDVGRQSVAFTRHVGADALGGIDLLVVRDGEIARTWSFTGTRTFPF